MPPPICPNANVALRTIRRPLCLAPATLSQMPSRNTSNTPPKQKKYTYRLAASSSAKRTSPRAPKHNRDYFLLTSTSPNPQEPYLRSTPLASGEDAFFATTISGSQHDVAFGVADGVGGWQDQGVDPGEFSHGLVGFMASTAFGFGDREASGPLEGKGGGGGGREEVLRARGLLQKAYDAVISNPRIQAGGSTATLALARGDGNLEVANLGDSALLLLSPGKIRWRSEIQTHAFNTPYQLSKIPAQLQARQKIFGSQHFSETPKDAEVSRLSVGHGEVVLIATDGVWDNLSPGEVLSIVSRVMVEGGYWYENQSSSTPNTPITGEMLLNASLIRDLPRQITEANQEAFLPGLLARTLMREAKTAGLDRRRMSPFAKEVQARFPDEGWEGGKPDDIAVVVCVVVEEGGDGVEGEGQQGQGRLKAKL